MNRRDFMVMAPVATAAGLAFPVLADAGSPDVIAPKFKSEPYGSWTQWVPLEVSKSIELPLDPGDEIVAMTVHHDEICVASKRGHIYWIRPA